MKKLLAFMFIFATICIGYNINHEHQLKTEWENSREVITVIVQSGDTLDAFAYEYKPSWMNAYDYRECVIMLNELPNSNIQIGDRLKLYAVK